MVTLSTAACDMEPLAAEVAVTVTLLEPSGEVGPVMQPGMISTPASTNPNSNIPISLRLRELGFAKSARSSCQDDSKCTGSKHHRERQMFAWGIRGQERPISRSDEACHRIGRNRESTRRRDSPNCDRCWVETAGSARRNPCAANRYIAGEAVQRRTVQSPWRSRREGYSEYWG